ncbi:TPA: hypothetical protein L9T63_004136 [Klebsiella pneumoniae]|nr:hypothetical protein [Klebsiella pneumoniae]
MSSPQRYEETELEFDLRLNDTLRSRKGDSEYWKASEKMLEYWLVAFAGRRNVEMTEALNAIRDSKMAFVMSLMERPPSEHVGQQYYNVTDLAVFRKKRQH